MEFQLVHRQAELAVLVQDWILQPEIAIDTEFERQRSFYPKPALIQVSDGVRCWLIDPLTLSDLSPLTTLLQSLGTVKVLHASSEDLKVLHLLCGVVPTPIFDTQIAAALLGFNLHMSYTECVERFFREKLPNDQTRSDWLRRPLNRRQLQYAMEDVAWLLPLYRQMCRGLESCERMDWLQEDCRRLLKNIDKPLSDIALLRRIKGGSRMRGARQKLLLRLCRWREKEAQRKNRIRKLILPDDLLLVLHKQCPNSVEALLRIPNLQRMLSNRQIRELSEIFCDFQGAPEEPVFDENVDCRNRDSRQIGKQLQADVRKCADNLKIEPALLMTRDECYSVALDYCKSGCMPEKLLDNGWRSQVLGDVFSDNLAVRIPSGDGSAS